MSEREAMQDVAEAAQCFAKQRVPAVEAVMVMLGKPTGNGKRAVIVDFGGMKASRAAKLAGAIYGALVGGFVSRHGDFDHLDIRGVDWGPLGAETVRVCPGGAT
jgi:hypothetical protein